MLALLFLKYCQAKNQHEAGKKALRYTTPGL
jgi:hypothetical protein